MDPEPVVDEELPRRSSWSAALSQLPGYPREERPVVAPELSETARTVTPMKSADD
jgi:hypothetical protein